MSSAESRLVAVYDRYHPQVASYCARRLSPDFVEDAVSEVFLTAWRKIDDIPDGERALPWLYGVAYKVVGRVWRTANRRKNLAGRLHALGVVPVPFPDEVLVTREEADQVMQALERLGPVDKEILLLAAWEELTYPEITEVLDLRPEAVRQRFHKAKKRLTREFNRAAGQIVSAPAAGKGGV